MSNSFRNESNPLVTYEDDILLKEKHAILDVRDTVIHSGQQGSLGVLLEYTFVPNKALWTDRFENGRGDEFLTSQTPKVVSNLSQI